MPAQTEKNVVPAQPERRRGLRIARRKSVAEPEPITRTLPDGEGRGMAKGRATPSRRQREEEAEEPQGNVATRGLAGFSEYFQGVRTELQKVSWPTREETRRLVTIVIIALIIASIVLGIISGFFTQLFTLGLDQPLILLGFMVLAIVGGFFIVRALQRQQSY